MTRLSRALMAGSALALAVVPVMASPAMAQDQPVRTSVEQAQPSLNLSATGRVKVAPDQATLNFGVMTEAATAQEAMQTNATQMTRVVEALRRAGIDQRDIQTSGLNLSAQYDYQENQSPRLRGYQAVNRVTVVIRDLSKTGRTADAVVAAGVNQIDGISFGLQNPGAAEDQARRLAVQALQAKAALYAEALGRPLGSIRNLTEGGGYRPAPQMAMYARAASADATPVEAGELEVSIDITGVYDLR
ncbi:SIMPL domain-containing protein [uncultured Brevundimonas sp.]|uniref:SIMPL domain-containing protein n=1 Tax=uncultured Brevundimonas sp. TaxID=213418 RepID=UPI002636A602|nr:SIMPL domain-containing protein [uncultured Brevundimonas sp.]